MNTSLDHLPPRKRDQLGSLAGLLREAGPVEMIVLFGSHARGDWVEDAETGYESDYDLLVLVESPKVADDTDRWGPAEQRIARLPDMPPVSLIVHDVKYVNEQLRRGQYFFNDIASEGVLLYTSGAFTLTSHRMPSPAERQAQAESDFEYWSTSANEFYDDFEGNLAKGRYSKAAFELHQAAERFLSAALLGLSAYKPRTHNLEKLADRAAGLHPDLRPVLPRALPEDRRLFDLLKKAYVDARYSKKYRITGDELTALGARVRELGAVVERVSREKIATLG
jgi:uncharacterized protein